MLPPTPLLFLVSRRLLLRSPRSCHRLSRPFSTPSSHPPELDLSHPTYMIWGSNTGVGKTLVSAGLAFSVLSKQSSPAKFLYLKPVQTGFPQDSDARFVFRKVSDLFLERHVSSPRSLLASNHVLKASASAAGEVPGREQPEKEGLLEGFIDLCFYEERRVRGAEREGEDSKLVCKTLYGWKEAISPHLAVERECAGVEDSQVLESLAICLRSGLRGGESVRKEDAWRVIETAGGVASPGPSGTLQCDLYRPFRLPAILVGDGRLGGISGTISSYESLKLRGYDVVAVILEDRGLSNEVPLLSYLRNRVQVLVMPTVPEDPSDNLMEWFCKCSEVFNSLQDVMLTSYLDRMQRLHVLAGKAGDILWWPFTQHKLVNNETITVIDSRCGENFSVHKVQNEQDIIAPQFDACASWWTQGPDATLQIELARDMGYTTARYGHVMFPENVYEPALCCAELLLEGVGRGWASRVFFSDNGSTAVEIALKMAFRKFLFDHGFLVDLANGNLGERFIELKVLALNGSYHGDTLGAMEAQAPSCYTGFLQQPWYSGRGLFLDPPTVFICDGSWNLSIPKDIQFSKQKLELLRFSLRDELFYGSRDSSDLAGFYSAYISKQLSDFSGLNRSAHIGALIIEPVIHGAGGMHLVDPLFQRILVKECQSHKIPVVFDEVFTGFWRLGRESAAELLGCFPDVACYAKLMTGGVIPLAVTLATEAVFNAFKQESKIMALLHGHSYSAHAMGCAAAVKAIKWFKDPQTNRNITEEGWKLKELWDLQFVHQISCHVAVQRVIALGTLCAIELKTEGLDAGYASMCATSLIQKLRDDGVYMRPLGNVIYIMCGPCTPPEVCNEQLRKIYLRIDEFSQARATELEANHGMA